MSLRSAFARALALIVASLLAAVACGGEADMGTATSLDTPTTPVAPTTSPTSSTSTASVTTTTATATTSPMSSTTVTVSTIGPIDIVGRDLIGQLLETEWIMENEVQIYLIAGRPIGLRSGTRLPLAWAGDKVSVLLGFADWSGIAGLRGPYDREWDGEILLLEFAGQRAPGGVYQVRDQVSVKVPAGKGLTAAMCFEGGVPHAVELRFTDDGPRITRGWSIDLDNMVFQPVDPGAITCPDLGARPIGPGAEGAIVTAVGRAAPGGNLGHQIELSGASPLLLPVEYRGDFWIGEGRGDDLSMSLVRDRSLEPGAGWLRLSAFLGWDYAGTPIWRVIDAVQRTSVNVNSQECRTAADQFVVAITEDGETAPIPIEAWTVSDDRTEIVTVDVAEVICEYIGSIDMRGSESDQTPGP